VFLGDALLDYRESPGNFQMCSCEMTTLCILDLLVAVDFIFQKDDRHLPPGDLNHWKVRVIVLALLPRGSDLFIRHADWYDEQRMSSSNCGKRQPAHPMCSGI
jgi:hypothetical protein